MINPIVFVSPCRNYDGSLLVHYLCTLQKQGLAKTELIVVVGQPLIERALEVKRILTLYGLENSIPIALGDPTTENILYTRTPNLQKGEEVFDSAFVHLKRLFNPTTPLQTKYSIIAASGLNELYFFLVDFSKALHNTVKEVVLMSGVKAVGNEHQQAMFDGSTNNIAFVQRQEEMNLLSLLKPAIVHEKSQIKVRIVTKHLAKSVRIQKSFLEENMEQNDLLLTKQSLQLLHLLSRMNPTDSYRLNRLPIEYNSQVFWSQFTEIGQEIELSPLDSVWDKIDHLNFYDIFCAMILFESECFHHEDVQIVSAFTKQKIHVEVYGYDGKQSIVDQVGVESTIRSLFNS
ncbi:MAG: hypothetical protein ACRCXZ_07865 [Patescibacteria group bacterium]